MIIVAGTLTVDPAERDDYLASCVLAMDAARRAPGCLDFALSADLLEPTRINVFERWSSADALYRFRGTGPSEDDRRVLRAIDVQEYRVVGIDE